MNMLGPKIKANVYKGKTFTSIDKPLIEEKALVPSESLDDIPIIEDKEYIIHVLCNHSIRKRNQNFSNYVESAASNPVNTKICKTIKLHSKQMKESDLPFKNAEVLRITRRNTLERLNDILTEYINGPIKEGDESVINVCWYPDSASGLNYKENGNKLRVLYRLSDNDEEIEIVLIDPNHLFATDNFEKQYNKSKSFQVDIKDLYQSQYKLFK